MGDREDHGVGVGGREKKKAWSLSADGPLVVRGLEVDRKSILAQSPLSLLSSEQVCPPQCLGSQTPGVGWRLGGGRAIPGSSSHPSCPHDRGQEGLFVQSS